MTDHPPDDTATTYVQALRGLADVLVDRSTLRSTLEQLLTVAAAAAPDVTALTVTAIEDDGGITSAAWNDDRAREVDQREYALHEGPCIASLETGEEQLVTDTRDDGRWPAFDAIASEAGFRTVAGIPLTAPDGRVLGALNVFSEDVDGLSEPTLAILRRVAAPAGAVLANGRAYRRTAALGEQLAADLEERAVVNRAVGIVLARSGGEPSEALRTLQRAAEHADRSVEEVAARLVAGEPVELLP